MLSAQKMEQVTYSRRTLQPIQNQGSPITDVLQRCSDPDCQEIRTTTLDGHWTLEELKRGT